MCLSPRSLFVPLAVAVAVTAGLAKAGPVDDLLPPPVRQTEKRTLSSNNNESRMMRMMRYGMDMSSIGAIFSPDGKYLLTAGNGSGLTLWEVRTGREVGALADSAGEGGVTGAFTPDGKQIVLAHAGRQYRGEGSPVGLWDVARRQRVRKLDEDVNDTPFSAVAVAPEGTTVALAGGPGRGAEPLTIYFWELASGDEVRRIGGLINAAAAPRGIAAEALAYAPNGRTLAVLLPERVLLVELATGKLRCEFAYTLTTPPARERSEPTMGSLAFSPDGRTLAAGCSDGTIHRFDVRSGRELLPFSGHKGPVLALHWTFNGQRLQTFGMDGQFLVWRTNSQREWKPKASPLTNEELEALWDTLRGDDARDLFGCQQVLAASPTQALPFLRKRLLPVPKEDAQRLNRLIEDMQKGDYNKRKRAVRELRKIGAAAVPALVKSQERGGFDELTRRLTMEMSNLAPPQEQTRSLRALRVLERMNNEAARKYVAVLAAGAPEAAFTLEAKAVLERMGKARARTPVPPEALWNVLASENGVAAYEAVRALASRPAEAARLRTRLLGVLAAGVFDDDPKRVAKLIGDLGSSVFAERDAANKALRNLGRSCVPALRKALSETADPEVKRSLEKLIASARNASPSSEMLRVARTLEALEMMDAPEGRQALDGLAKGARVRWVRAAAVASLLRQHRLKP